MRSQRTLRMAVTGAVLLLGVGTARATADGPDSWVVSGVAADDVLNIRAAPSAASPKIGEIPPTARLIPNLGCQGGPSLARWERMSAAERLAATKSRWCRVRYKDVEGWVAGRVLREDGD